MDLLRSLAAGLVACAPLSLAARGVSYECVMFDKGNGGWVGERMILSLDPETGAGAVYDAALALAKKPPKPVDVTRRSDTLWRYRWEVRDVPSQNEGTSHLSYSALLNTRTGLVTLNGNLHGYENVISGRGRCNQIKQ